MFSVNVEFSATDDPQGNPQWWSYKITTNVPGFESVGEGFEDTDSGWIGEIAMADYAFINERYWAEHQLTLF